MQIGEFETREENSRTGGNGVQATHRTSRVDDQNHVGQYPPHWAIPKNPQPLPCP